MSLTPMVDAKFTLRTAQEGDIAEMHRVRLAVRENRLTSSVISAEDYRREITETGKGWVIVKDAQVVGFAVANRQTASIWALFIAPGFEGCGLGRQLLAVMVYWLWQQGAQRVSLTTEPNTRAAAFYTAAGWRNQGLQENGDCLFSLLR
ncbi:MAG: GNAT family N-acetyltransferase [Gammaproteobacteria bacterium]|nr:GNAT family N-acetyltransferase [Gammaproteobacteria bacterium]